MNPRASAYSAFLDSPVGSRRGGAPLFSVAILSIGRSIHSSCIAFSAGRSNGAGSLYLFRARDKRALAGGELFQTLSLISRVILLSADHRVSSRAIAARCPRRSRHPRSRDTAASVPRHCPKTGQLDYFFFFFFSVVRKRAPRRSPILLADCSGEIARLK